MGDGCRVKGRGPAASYSGRATRADERNDVSLGFSIVGTVPQAFDHPEHGLVGLRVTYLKLW